MKTSLLFLIYCGFHIPLYAQDSVQVLVKGRLNAVINDETSGLVASTRHKGILYIHNDSGDTSRFFAISEDGTLNAIYTFQVDHTRKNGVRDVEDIALGKGPKGRRYIYIGDIGDNNARRSFITIYRIREPKPGIAAGVSEIAVKADPLHLRYPDGPRDAETLMIDPLDQLFYIISKREDSVSVYTAPLRYKSGDTVMLVKRTTLFFQGNTSAKWISGGDISPDGRQVLVKSYLNVFYWKRNKKEPIWQVLQNNPRVLSYKVEKQGEAIGFSADGRGYFTISEGVHPDVNYYLLN